MGIHNYPGQKIPLIPFDYSAYYNQFFNQKLKDEEIERQQYHPQDRHQRTEFGFRGRP